jgi:hypothetical protein
VLSKANIRALNEVMYRAVLHARIIGNGARFSIRYRFGNQWCSHIADLMDAVHNIPIYLRRPENANLDLLLCALDNYDQKWNRNNGGIGLRQIYEKALMWPDEQN